VHDLKTPMNALTLHLELLRKSLEDGADRDGQMATIGLLQREIQRLAAALDAFAAAALDSGGSPRRFDLRQVARDAARESRPEAAAAGVRVETRLADEPVHLLASSVRVKQALLAVLSGMRASCAGGALRVTVERDGHAASVSVRESVEHDTPRSAAPPTRDDLDLSAARALVEDQGGRLELVPPPGHGVRFVFPAS
jgi:signal transduction histidine kinase